MRFGLRRAYKRIRRRTRNLGQGYHIISLMVLALLFLSLSLSGYHLFLKEGGLDHSMAKSLLYQGLPNIGVNESEAISGVDFSQFLYWLTNYDVGDPLSLVASTLPFSPQVVVHLRMWEERPFVFVQELSFAPDPVRPEPVVDPRVPESLDVLPTAPKVLIYHTHTSEMYLGRAVSTGQSSQAHYQFRNLADPTITGVMAVGNHLSNALTSLGLQTFHETRIHTLPSINSSYSNSERTVREILNKHKDFDLVIDLHRDAGVPNPTTMVNGREVARIAIIVGTAQNIPLVHPNFQENLALAQQIKSQSDTMYPGLMRPVQIHKGARYNQHLHPASLIFEIGSVENSLEEALLAAELLANLLARVL